ncbi:MAG: CsiV family protein [Porticoccus sp.]|nr:CsiV family protein [Porticoccus sp.]
MNHLSHIISILTFIALPIIAQTAYAEDTSWYQIEVLVFSQQDLYREEKHRIDVQLSYPDNWRNLYDPSSPQNRIASSASSETNSVLDPSASTNNLAGADKESYVALPQNLLKLGPDNYTLKRAPGYRPLYHKAWRQQGLDFQQSPWILIQGGEQYGNHHELEGSFRLVMNRYLHIQANLWKARFASLAPPLMIETVHSDTVTPGMYSPESSVSEGSSLTRPMLPNLPGTEVSEGLTPSTPNNAKFQVTDIITLEQSSRVSRDEITYLDHPEMGVLVLVSKYEE